MKRVLYTIIFAALAAIACKEVTPEVLQDQAQCASVSLSSASVVLTMQSQSKTIFVASNRSEIDVKCSADWLDISVEDGKIVLYADENSEVTDRLAIVDVVAGAEPDTAVERLKVLQKGEGSQYLSAEGTANCYIAHSCASYSFDATVKGNGKGDGYSNYILKHGVKIKGATYATLAWEATYDGDKTRSTKIIEGEPLYNTEDGRVYFTTGESEGNALITIHNGAGETLWSWHIWVTDATPMVSYGKRLDWMDRNLGALTNAIGDIANRGMLYQWGRKEPFLPSYVEYMTVPRHSYDDNYNLLETEEEYYAIQAEIERVREQVNLVNTQVGNGNCTWNYVGNVPPVALEAPGNIEYAIQHPTTILGCRVDIPIGEYLFDWYLQQDLVGSGGMMQQSQSLLWGNAVAGTDYKSIFDPCPVGYAVPPCGAFGTLESGYACTYVDSEWQMSDHGWIWRGGNGDYFPSTGNLDVSGLIGETGERILYWTAETFGSGAEGFGKSATLFEAFNDVYYGVYPILDPVEAGAWYSYGARCYAAPVRCVKEN